MKTMTYLIKPRQSFVPLFLCLAILIFGCKKEEEVVITYGNVTDIEGNTYSTVRYNNGKEWMAENLKVTKYNNNTPISYPGNDNVAWSNTQTGAYAWYENNVVNKNIYGALYNGFAVTSSAGLCPVGWRVPNNEDFQELIALFGGLGEAGGKLKKVTKEPSPHPRWDMPNTDATNASGFSALPGGIRYANGEFNYLGKRADFWSSSPNVPYNDGLYLYNMHHDDAIIGVGSTLKNSAFSVRCVKDH